MTYGVMSFLSDIAIVFFLIFMVQMFFGGLIGILYRTFTKDENLSVSIR